MCGDLEDEEENGAEQLYAAFLQAAHAAIHERADHRGGSRGRLGQEPGPPSDATLHSYMDGLFAEILRACITDGARVEPGHRYQVLAGQAVVLARVAGFLGGRLDPAQDPLRNVIEALMAGYADDGGHHHH
ncbi:MAG TPA: hypothetical protein VKP60_10010 [Magnetospirillaceae bacterium]|nr:hypothetical protein [Magnetospirillaceae bacterium]